MSSNQEIYLDYAATTPVDPAVSIAMRETETDCYANASSLHSSGQRSKVRIEKARQTIAAAIEAAAMQIVFTSGGTESNNLALLGTAFANRAKGRHIITSAVEHPSVLQPCKYLANNGFEIEYLPVDTSGNIDLIQLEKLLRPETILVSIMTVNNETGCIFPVKEIGELLQDKDVLFHTDAIQAFGKIDISISELNVDIVSLAAHKIYGPKGVGALFIRDGTKLQKIFYGGEQEIRRRPGTENIVAIAGFAEAVEQLTIQKSERKRLCALREDFEKELLNKIPDIKINCQETERVYSISNMYFPCLPGDSMLMNLDMKGIFISTGSACSSGSQSPSHVLSAMGFDEQRVANSIRISLGRFTTKSHLSQAIDAIYNICQTRSERKRDRGL